MILSKITFLSNIFPIPNNVLSQIESKIFNHIWPFTTKEPTARQTLYLPKTQGGIGLLEPQKHSIAMRLKHFLLLKDKQNQESWLLFLKYYLVTTLYNLQQNFRYLIFNNILKTDYPKITFHNKDIITFIKKHPSILDVQRKPKTLYQEIIKLEYQTYNILGQSIWNQHLSQIPWNAIWKKTLSSYTWPENNIILYILLHYATRTNDHIFRWTNQKHLKNPTCKYCKNIENIKHIFVECKRNRKIWTHFQKYQKLENKDYTPLQHTLSMSAISIPSNTKKLILTLTVTILTHIWKTRNRHQFDDTIIPTTNTIINIKIDLKIIIQIHFRQHQLSNTLDEFKMKFCIHNTFCLLTDDSLKILL